MSGALTLTDPKSGQEVRLGPMELPQTCALCGGPMQGEWGMATPDGLGWTHLSHYPRRLLGLELTPQARARVQAADQLRDAGAGDRVVVTNSMLVALGTGR